MFILYALIEQHVQVTREGQMSSGYEHLTNMFVNTRPKLKLEGMVSNVK